MRKCPTVGHFAPLTLRPARGSTEIGVVKAQGSPLAAVGGAGLRGAPDLP